MSDTIKTSILRGPQFYKFSDCFLDTLERRLFKKNQRLDITPKALEVLQVLVENAGEVVSKDDLLGQIWGDSFVEEGNLPVQISKLRSELGADKNEPYIVTESGVGYKFVSPVSIVDDDEWADLIENELAQHTNGKEKYTSIAIMPLFNEGGDEEIEYLADGITESIINSLSDARDLRVIARNTVFQFKETKIDIKKLGRKLRVATILTGRVRVVRNKIVIGVELSKVSDGTQIWGLQISEPFDDIFEVQEKLSTAVAKELVVQVRRQSGSKKTGNGNDPQSYRLCLMGNFFLAKRQKDQVFKAIECYKKAILLDPTNIAALARIGYAYFILHCFESVSHDDALKSMQSNLQFANRLDPSNVDQIVYTGVQKLFLEYKIQRAIQLFESVLATNPDHVECLGFYARAKSYIGDFAASARALKRISRVNPFSLSGNIAVANVLYTLGRYEEALERFNEVIEIEPAYYSALLGASAALIELSRFEDAIGYLDAASRIQETQEAISLKGYALASSGFREEAIEIINQLKNASAESTVPFTYIGIVYAALDLKSEALDCLEDAFDEKYTDLVGLQVDPRWRNVKDEPRFTRVLKKIGFE